MLHEKDVFVALGANLPDSAGNSPLSTCQTAVFRIGERFGGISAQSSWYLAEPVPRSDQSWYVNGVIRIATDWPPDEILLLLHDLERQAGRVRRRRWEARILDLDLLAHGSSVMAGPSGPILPHPRLGERAFVLRPLLEISTSWRHPENQLSAKEMLENLPSGQRLLRLP